MRILEEFWYGNIEPTEYDTSSCEVYKEVLQLITRNERKLLATMRMSRRNCSPDIRTLFMSIRSWQNAGCFKTASSWAQDDG